VVECLPTKQEALSSNPITAAKKKKKIKGLFFWQYWCLNLGLPAW
jgi:hypothetical protein